MSSRREFKPKVSLLLVQLAIIMQHSNTQDITVRLCRSPGSCHEGGGTCYETVEETGSRRYCHCKRGWTGENCSENIDDCKNAACSKGSTCIDGVDNFICQCSHGRTGLLCHLEDACISNPCGYNSPCHTNPINGKFGCSCPSGFVGTSCDLDIDECSIGPGPCENGGQCMNTIGSFLCQCPYGYTGTHCEENINWCDYNPCPKNETCIYHTEGYHCICEPGQNCTKRLCSSPGSCQNGGTCYETVGDNGNRTYCHCMRGWTGKDCSENIDECQDSPCAKGSTCFDGVDSFSCQCPHGRTGLLCHLRDASVSNPCLNGGQSHANPINGEVICSCQPGYKGQFCHLYDACLSSPCLNGGQCHTNPTNGKLTCSCLPGYKGAYCHDGVCSSAANRCQNGGKYFLTVFGSCRCHCPNGYMGKRCEIVLNWCKSSPCLKNETCIDHMEGYQCICEPGQDCTQRDCGPFGRCQNGGTCLESGSKRSCICKDGWTGEDCSENIDDCVMASCAKGATCIDRVASFFCQCPYGRTGLLCHLDDACINNPCRYREHCDTNPVNGKAICTCPIGFMGPSCYEDVDECSLGVNLCERGGKCLNTVGCYRCECPHGYTGKNCHEVIMSDEHPFTPKM